MSVPEGWTKGWDNAVTIPGNTLANQNNNPGNLRFVGQANASEGNGGFASFPTPDAGYNALKRQVELDASRGHTLGSFIAKYAPPVENDTDSYVDFMEKETGSKSNDKLSSIDIDKVSKAIAKFESGSFIQDTAKKTKGVPAGWTKGWGAAEKAIQNQAIAQSNLANRGDIARGLISGFDETQGSFYGMGALAGSALKKMGAEKVGGWLKEKGMEGYRRNMEEASLNPTNTLDDVDGVGSAIDWAQGTFGKLLPSMATAALGTVSGAGVAAIGAKTVFKKAVTEMAEKGVKDQIAKGLIKKGTEASTKKALEKAITRTAMKISGKVGMGGAVLPMEAGGNYADLLEQHGIDAPMTSLGFGALATALEYVGGNSKLIDNFLGSVVRGDGNIIKRTAKELLKNIPAEAGQEAGQEVFSILNTVVNTDEQFLTRDNIKRIFESAAAGAIGGGIGGLTSGAFSKAKLQDSNTNQQPDQSVKKDIPNDPFQDIAEQTKGLPTIGKDEYADINPFEPDTPEWQKWEAEIKRQQKAKSLKENYQRFANKPDESYSDTIPFQEVPNAEETKDIQDIEQQRRQREIQRIKNSLNVLNTKKKKTAKDKEKIQALTQQLGKLGQSDLAQQQQKINQGRINQQMSDEEAVDRETNQAMAGKSDFLQKIDMMQNEVNTTQTKGVNQEPVNEQGETVAYSADSPKWMRELPPYIDSKGKKRIYSRAQLNAVFNNIKTGKKLKEAQSTLFNHIKNVTDTYAGETGEFVAQDEANDLEKRGFDLLGGQKVPVADLNEGDKFVGTVDGVKDEFEVKDTNENGETLLQDGIAKRVDMFDEVTVEGIKYAERPDGTLKTKAEYTPEEWKEYTNSVVDQKYPVSPNKGAKPVESTPTPIEILTVPTEELYKKYPQWGGKAKTVQEKEQSKKDAKNKTVKEIDSAIKVFQDEISDWSGREYKKNSKIVSVGGTKDDLNSGITSIDRANENRRQRNIEDREQSILELEKVKKLLIAGEDEKQVWGELLDSRHGPLVDFAKNKLTPPTEQSQAVDEENNTPAASDTSAPMGVTLPKGRILFTKKELSEFDRLGLDVSGVTEKYKTEALQQLQFQQDNETNLNTPGYNDRVQDEYDRIAQTQKEAKAHELKRLAEEKIEIDKDLVEDQSTKETPAAKKPRLSENPKSLYQSFMEKSKSGVVSKKHGLILYPYMQEVGDTKRFVAKNNKLAVLSTWGDGYRDATESELEEIHKAIERDAVEISLLTQWGNENSGKRPSKQADILHNPSGNSFKKKEHGQPSKQKPAEKKPTDPEIRENRTSDDVKYQTTYHGTPHTWTPEPGFPHGRPRLDKIGTGEGAAAYGHGWYSADRAVVGDTYRKSLSGPRGFGGKNSISSIAGIPIEDVPYNDITGTLINAINVSSSVANRKSIQGNLRYAKEYANKYTDSYYGLDKKELAKTRNFLEKLSAENIIDSIEYKTGALYTLDIPDAVIPQLLDWDAPLSEQSEYVKKAIQKLNKDGRITNKTFKAWFDDAVKRDKSGADLYTLISTQIAASDGENAHSGNDKKASEYLASIGIPGNKYLDGMSRGKGEGSYNYVLWDQSVLDQVALLERNGEKLEAIQAAYQALNKTEKKDKIKTLTAKDKIQAKAKEDKEKKNALHNNQWNKISGNTGSTTRQRLRSAIAQVGDPDKAKITLPSNKKEKALHKLAKALGIKPVYFKTSDTATRVTGFYFPGTTEVFINLSSGAPINAVFGHELVHYIKDAHPDLYDYLVKEFEKNKKDYFLYVAKEQVNREMAGLEKLSEEKALEEFIADFANDSFQRVEFWDKLYKKSPSMFQNLVDSIKKIFGKIKSVLTRSEQYILDVDKAQNDMVKVIDTVLRRVSEDDNKSLEGTKESSNKPSYMFAGPESRTADKSKAFEAQQMRDNGVSRSKVWKDTGWWEIVPGSDVFSYEIDDSKVQLKPIPVEDGELLADGKLSDLVQADELFKSYPWLRGVKALISVDPGLMSESGVYRTDDMLKDLPGEPNIYVKAKTEDQARSILLHEIQHNIQENEGFASGGNPKATKTKQQIKDEALAKTIIYSDKDYISDKMKNEAEKALSMLNKQLHKQYQILTGEAQSRLTQARLDMTKAQRKLIPPWKTLEKMMKAEGLLKEGQKPEDVLISRDSEGMAMSEDGQRSNTDTKAFKKWFGDSVVTVDGQPGSDPLVVYHGTATAFTDGIFDIGRHGRNDRGWYGKGFSFTENADIADMYSSTGGHNANIIPVYLNIEKPYILGTNDKFETALGKLDAEGKTKLYKQKGYDGVINYEEDGWIIEALVFEPTQIKSATGNNGEFDATNPDIRFQTEDSSFDMRPESTLAETIYYNLVDEFSSIDKAYKALKKDIPDEADFGSKARRRVNISKKKLDDFNEAYIQRIAKAIGENDLSIADVDEFLYSRHAPEANARLRLTNARYYLNKLAKAQKGSKLAKKIKEFDSQFDLLGFPTQQVQEAYLNILERELSAAPEKLIEAEASLDEYKNTLDDNPSTAERDKLIRLQKDVQKVQAELKIRKEWDGRKNKLSGMTDEKAEEIQDKWQGNAAIDEIASIFDDMNAEALKVSRDAGRLSEEEYQAVKGTFEYYAPLYREGFENSRKGRSGGLRNLGSDVAARGGSTKPAVNILANAILKGQTTIINAGKADVARSFLEFVKKFKNDKFLDFVELKTKAVYDEHGNIKRVNDQQYDEETETKVKVDGKTYLIYANPKNVHAQRIIKAINGNNDKTGPIVNALGKLSRGLARVNTTWNPEFLLSNFSRDIQMAMVTISDTEAKTMRKQVLKNIPNAMKGLHSLWRGDKSHEWAKIANDWEKVGGRVGWIDYGDNIEEHIKKLATQANLHRKGHTTLKAWHGVFKWVEDYNSIVENAVRLSTYNSLIKSGVPKAKAALTVRNLTVDFNKKGAYGPVINSAYMFANAGIQGSVKTITTLVKSKQARKIVGGAMVSAFGLAIANSVVGGDDEDGLPYYDQLDSSIKQRNIIFMLPGTKGRYVKIPSAWGFNVFWNFGTELGDMMVQKGYKPADGASRLLMSAIDAFNPLQSASLAQMLSPTALDPVIQVAENKTWSGAPLMPEGNVFDRTPQPDSETYWKSVRPISKKIAQGLNYGSGGNKIKPGLVDISPETLDLVWDTFTGGAGRFAVDTLMLPVNMISGTQEFEKSPFVRRFLGKPSEYKQSQDYRNNITHIYRLKEQVEEYPDKRKTLMKDRTYRLLPVAKKTESRLRKLNKVMKAAKTQKAKNGIKDRMDEIKKQFNQKFINLREAS